MAPSEQETARLKNNGRTPSNKLVTKNVNAEVGKLKIAIRHKGFTIPSLIFNFRLIIKIFNTEVAVTQSPIPTISDLMPIKAGRNQIETKRKTEPTR